MKIAQVNLKGMLTISNIRTAFYDEIVANQNVLRFNNIMKLSGLMELK